MRELGPPGTHNYPHGYDTGSSKRQRTSADLTTGGLYAPNQTYGDREHEEQRSLYSSYTLRGQPPSTYDVPYTNATPAPSSDFTYRHQRTDSSSTTSPYASPRNEVPGYTSSGAAATFPPQARESFYSYPTGSLPIVPSRPAQLAHNLPTVRSQALTDPPPTAAASAYTRTSAPEESVLGVARQTPRFYATNASQSVDSRPLLSGSLLDSMGQGNQYATRSPFTNVLPPLESTITAGPTRGLTLQTFNPNSISSASLMSMPAPSMPEAEVDHQGQQALNYSPMYRRRDEG